MGVARKWHFSTSKIATNLGGDSRDLNEHRGSGITFLGISSLNRHFLVLFPGPIYYDFKHDIISKLCYRGVRFKLELYGK